MKFQVEWVWANRNSSNASLYFSSWLPFDGIGCVTVLWEAWEWLCWRWVEFRALHQFYQTKKLPCLTSSIFVSTQIKVKIECDGRGNWKGNEKEFLLIKLFCFNKNSLLMMKKCSSLYTLKFNCINYKCSFILSIMVGSLYSLRKLWFETTICVWEEICTWLWTKI